jgi:hypothetical protein
VTNFDTNSILALTSSFKTPSSFSWTNVTVDAALADVPYFPAIVIKGLLNYFATHCCIVETWNKRIGSVVEKVRTASVIEGVALITFYRLGFVRTSLNSSNIVNENHKYESS